MYVLVRISLGKFWSIVTWATNFIITTAFKARIHTQKIVQHTKPWFPLRGFRNFSFRHLGHKESPGLSDRGVWGISGTPVSWGLQYLGDPDISGSQGSLGLMYFGISGFSWIQISQNIRDLQDSGISGYQLSWWLRNLWVAWISGSQRSRGLRDLVISGSDGSQGLNFFSTRCGIKFKSIRRNACNTNCQEKYFCVKWVNYKNTNGIFFH